MTNPNCPCANTKCPMFGNCTTCRPYHKIGKPYCESGRIRRASMRFTFNAYLIINKARPPSMAGASWRVLLRITGYICSRNVIHIFLALPLSTQAPSVAPGINCFGDRFQYLIT
jgi:hypothetical protein